jgi:hypothetical protein
MNNNNNKRFQNTIKLCYSKRKLVVTACGHCIIQSSNEPFNKCCCVNKKCMYYGFSTASKQLIIDNFLFNNPKIMAIWLCDVSFMSRKMFKGLLLLQQLQCLIIIGKSFKINFLDIQLFKHKKLCSCEFIKSRYYWNGTIKFIL